MTTSIATAKLNEINPLAWLADVLAGIADLPWSGLHELRPLAAEAVEPVKGRLITAAIAHVFTIRRAAQILGRDEDLL